MEIIDYLEWKIYFASPNLKENSKKNLSYSLIRPYLLKNSKKIVSMGFKSHNYYNDGFTNLDNNSEIIAYHNISNYNEYYFRVFIKNLIIEVL